MFAVKLKTYSHIQSEDMQTLYEGTGVHSKILDEALKRVVKNCPSCKGTGRPLQKKFISLRKVLSSFSSHAQLDFFYITELHNAPVLHLVEFHTGFSATAAVNSRDIEIEGNKM